MSAFLLWPEADGDVWNIWRYLAEETGVKVANRIEADLFHAFETLTQTPGNRAGRWPEKLVNRGYGLPIS